MTLPTDVLFLYVLHTGNHFTPYAGEKNRCVSVKLAKQRRCNIKTFLNIAFFYDEETVSFS